MSSSVKYLNIHEACLTVVWRVLWNAVGSGLGFSKGRGSRIYMMPSKFMFQSKPNQILTIPEVKGES